MFNRIEKVVGVMAAVFLFALMMVTFIDVIGRNVFDRPLVGASEVTEILLVCVVFLTLPSVAFRQAHIVVDLADAVSGPILRSVQKVLSALLGAAFFGGMSWRLWILGEKVAGYADTTPSLGIPLAPFIFGMSILSGITGLICLTFLWRQDATTESHELAAAKRLAGEEEARHRSTSGARASATIGD
ncbi:TRAP transporter small permease [Aquibium sp. LZ166]|uniref:TRAP transporter small permease protein n=1 Tax=Aquibium pacificus TaxID=3153579 RepID=A0ABV3SNH2_9HYPH